MNLNIEFKEINISTSSLSFFTDASNTSQDH